MILYVDSSALLKRVVAEPDSSGLRALLRRHDDAGDLLTGSALCWLEVWRALRRTVAPHDVDRLAESALSGIAEFPLSTEVLDRARHIGPESLRSLDAVHLASAVAVGAMGLVTYDARLATGARSLGLVVEAPAAS